jgi:transcriptional regulator GlxA family with amidase domain
MTPSLLLALLLAALAATACAAPAVPAEAPGEDPPPADPRLRTVAVLVFEGVELLDAAGPVEVFIVAAEGKAFRVLLVAKSKAPVRTMGGVLLTPDATFADAPRADVVVVPGGDLRAVDAGGIDWIRRASADSEATLSVCFGAFLLARAGLLDGVEATTHRWGLADLAKAAPRCTVLGERRFVDAGRIVTTAGVTAGIDGALHLVERFLGPEAARWTAEEWMEHRR